MDGQILIIFSVLFQTQLAVKWPFMFPPHRTSVSALPEESRRSKILHFYLMQYHYLIQIMHIWNILSKFLAPW